MSDERILTGEQFVQALGQFLLDRKYSGLLGSHEGLRAERDAAQAELAGILAALPDDFECKFPETRVSLLDGIREMVHDYNRVRIFERDTLASRLAALRGDGDLRRK